MSGIPYVLFVAGLLFGLELRFGGRLAIIVDDDKRHWSVCHHS